MKYDMTSPLSLVEVAKLGVDAGNALVKRVRATIRLHKALTRNRFALSTSPNGRGDKGFTLVELSIVLVILGLLVGGVLAGQNLIRAAELRSIQSFKQEYQTAFFTFKDKYFAVPGELLIYQSFWPQLTGTFCPRSGFGEADVNGVVDTTFEYEAAPAQLQAAELMQMGREQILQDGTVRAYWDCFENNMQQTAAFYSKMGEGMPIKLTHWERKNGFVWGGPQIDGTFIPVTSSEETFLLDTKYDDGMPHTGSFMARRIPSMGFCTNNATLTVTTAEYNGLDDNVNQCYVHQLID